MIALNLPLLMLIVFLLFTLAVGLYFSRKTTTLREHAVGNKKFATATLVATILATAYGGGGLIRTVERVHNLGLYWVLFAMLSGFDIWIISPLAERMAPFMRHLSMAETIGSVYGKVPRIITALSSIASSIAIIAIQINVISLAIGMCASSVNPRLIAIIATLILIFYSAFGGIRAVTYTDVLQFMTFTIVIPLLTWLTFQKMGKPIADVMPFLQTKELFQFSSMFSWNTSLVNIIVLRLSGLLSYIDPPMMQRAYMASSPIQAKRIFRYAGILSFFIKIFIVLIGIIVFVRAPDLPMQDIWGYIMSDISPFFKGLIAISLLAMTMSTADSSLNTCSVMMSHDILDNIHDEQENPSSNKLWLTRLTSIVIGLCAMMTAFYSTDLLDLLQISFAFYIPIITAPFILAIFGFRGTAKTALIGMATGACTMWVWNQWIEPKTKIDGSFVCMLANGAAMMVAHYLLPQPKDRGWVGEDDEMKQRRQAKERKKARRKEKITPLFTKDQLANLTPDKLRLTCIGAYILFTAFFSLILTKNDWFNYWNILLILIASSFIGLGFMRTVNTPSWSVGLHWVIGLVFCLSLNTIFHWWNVVDYSFTFMLSISYLIMALLFLPLALGSAIVAATILITLYPIYCVGMPSVIILTTPTLLLNGILALLICAATIYQKIQLNTANKKNNYLQLQKKKQEEQELKDLTYTLNVTQKPAKDVSEEDGAILENVVRNVTQTISFLDNKKPLYKQDFQSIVNKFADWAAFLKRRSKSKDHLLLLPTETTISELISQVEVAVAAELGVVPRIFVEDEEKIKKPIVCDVDKIVDLWATTVLKIINKDTIETDMVAFRFHSASLAYHRCDDVKDRHPRWKPFSAVAIIMSNYNTPQKDLPIPLNCYNDTNPMEIRRPHGGPANPKPIDLTTRSMHRIIRAHYGHIELPKPGKDGIIMVLPWDVNAIRDEMIAKLPIDLLASESPITPKEQADSLVALMEFHEYVCQVSHVESTVISEILLLLRRCYGFKRHASGELFYLRATGITKLVAKWIFHSPKPIYASLLYDLVRHTHLSLSYIKANYNFGIFCFVEHVLSIDNRQELEESVLFVENRFKEAVAQDKFSVLYIKLAERLYDLRNAAGYANKETLKSMAKETLSIDIALAKKYLNTEPEIAIALEAAAKNALEVCAAR